ncbi:phosphoglycerate mutase [Jannaschia pagri]|uniref:Phosphoglycerate mutase n=1 Tax=Jannaschia pagri TaxID=2829797 RepID=A0ABQ4NQ00_9RHOB|nr:MULTISPECIES: histidine phosphatase family protein [unclassified Jannaschia]GIT92525.1 phosphoglycerate mutase [Jannaschia sp. AI_61]GIT96360.1 phosphoglycerate mutase [Jannaschia sp. AI_62]
MKLILLRHAKSSWGDALLEDFDRPLNRRGREAAPRIGAWLRTNGHTPDVILCSSALRTRQTRDGLGFDDVTTEYHDDLYLAGSDLILKRLTAGKGRTTMVIGHNPGMAEAAAQAVSAPPVHPDFDRYPTGACTVVQGPLPGRPIAFLVPRDLPA